MQALKPLNVPPKLGSAGFQPKLDCWDWWSV